MTQTSPAPDDQILRTTLSAVPPGPAFFQAVVNAPYEQLPLKMAELFLGFICFYIAEGKEARFKAASDTEYYHLSIRDYPSFDPDNFRLPLSDTDNDIVRAIVDQAPVHSLDWSKVKRRDAAVETVRLNQATSGIAAAYVYPFATESGRGALMFNYFQYPEAIDQSQLDFMQKYTRLVSELFQA
jgi:hypothetical protein